MFHRTKLSDTQRSRSYKEPKDERFGHHLIVALVVIIALAIFDIVYSAIALQMEREHTYSMAHDIIRQTSSRISADISRLISDTDTILQMALLLYSPEHQAGYEEVQQSDAHLASILTKASFQNSGLLGLAIYSIHGPQLFHADFSEDIQTRSLGDIISEPHRTMGFPFVLHPPLVRPDHRTTIPISRHNNIDSPFVAAAFIDAFSFWDAIDSAMNAIPMDIIDHVYVYSDRGIVLASWTNNEDYDQKALGFNLSAMYPALDSDPNGIYRETDTTFETSEQTVGISPFSSHAINIMITAQKSAITAAWWKHAKFSAFLVFSIIAVVGIAAIYLYRQYTIARSAFTNLQESRQLYRDIATVSNDWFWETNAKNQIAQMSVAAGQMIEHALFPDPYTLSTNSHYRSILQASDFPRFIKATGSREPYRNLNWPIRLENGEIRWVRCSGLPIIAPDGTFQGYRGSAVDITDARRAAEVQEHHVRLSELGQMAGGVGHEFNNFLQTIINYTFFSIDEVAKNSRAYQYLTKSLEAANQASEVIRSMLTFARTGEKKLELLDVLPTFREAVGLARAAIPSSIRIAENYDPVTAKAIMNSAQLTQILINLVNNARDAIQGRGTITLALKYSNLSDDERASLLLENREHVEFSVTDTGTGIDPETLNKIFSPFFTTKPEGQGNGLGLPTVYGIVKSWSGAISVASEVGKGSTFTIYIPISADQR